MTTLLKPARVDGETGRRLTHLACAVGGDVALCGYRKPAGAARRLGPPYCEVCLALALAGHCPFCGGEHLYPPDAPLPAFDPGRAA